MFNLQGHAARQFYGQIVNTWHNLENSYARKIAPILSKQWRDVAGDVSDGHYNIPIRIAESTPRFTETMIVNYQRTANVYFDIAMKMLGLKLTDTSREIKDTDNIFWDHMKAWMQFETARQVTMINSTTRNVLQGIITASLNEGLSYVQTAKKIRELSPISNANRAMTIARTETHTIYSKSVNETIISSPAQVATKEWMAALDSRTRDPHVTANGQNVRMKDFFMVFGESLEYPGDPRGSAANIINCRCIALYNTAQ